VIGRCAPVCAPVGLILPDSTGFGRSVFRAFSLLTAWICLYDAEVSLASNPRSGTSERPANRGVSASEGLGAKAGAKVEAPRGLERRDLPTSAMLPRRVRGVEPDGRTRASDSIAEPGHESVIDEDAHRLAETRNLRTLGDQFDDAEHARMRRQEGAKDGVVADMDRAGIPRRLRGERTARAHAARRKARPV
jgi:hypothetical protein